MNAIGRKFGGILLACTLAPAAPEATAWGPEGHQVIGLLAEQQLSEAARSQLHELLGTSDPAPIADACNWPDRYRATQAGAWSEKQHYVNVPRGADTYLRGRDCPAGACSAEALKQYAAELGDSNLPAERRQRAWAWVCHLAGDIHQPMHSGYADDRGGNDFRVVYRGLETNLHAFWDTAMLRANYPDWRPLADDLAAIGAPSGPDGSSLEVDDWVRESHRLMRQFGYPEDALISREFAAERWLLARQRLVQAGARLAALVNQVLGNAGPP